MTAKSFFKSNVFKCLVTLLCVLLVSGIFLTIMNGLLEVTPEEKRNRAISKIYGTQVDVTELTAKDYNDSAKIEEAYKVTTDGNYLIKSTGLGAYKGGTVTCWVVVKVSDNAVSGVGKVVIDSNTNQTLMSQFNDSVLNQFSQKYNPDEMFTNQVITGPTAVLTENAICNSVNGAIDFVKAQMGDVWVDPYAEFDFVKNINTRLTAHEVKDDGSVEYHIATKGYDEADSFKIDITVDNTGVITYYKITSNGSTHGYEDSMPPKILSGEMFIGKNLEFFTGLYGEDMAYKAIASFDDSNVTTGATVETISSKSSYLCMYAGAFATANRQKCIDAENAGQGGQN